MALSCCRKLRHATAAGTAASANPLGGRVLHPVKDLPGTYLLDVPHKKLLQRRYTVPEALAYWEVQQPLRCVRQGASRLLRSDVPAPMAPR